MIGIQSLPSKGEDRKQPSIETLTSFWVWKKKHVSNGKNSGYLGYVGDYTTQLYEDYKNPLYGSLLTNQYNGK